MKYDARACHFNMDTGCVELLLRDGRMISINCTGVEDALDVTMAQRFELDLQINGRSIICLTLHQITIKKYYIRENGYFLLHNQSKGVAGFS